MSEIPGPVLQEDRPPRRFQTAIELNKRLVVRNIEAHGLENLEKIPPSELPVFAVSHIRSDTDLQLAAYVLMQQGYNVGISLFSTNRENPISNIGLSVAGQDHFFDVDIEEKKEGGQLQRTFHFNPENFEEMNNAMQKGILPIVAAHEAPIYTGILPNKSGFGVPYLEQLSRQGLVVPMLVDLTSAPSEPVGRIDHLGYGAKRIFKGRPEARVTVCEPIQFELVPRESLDIMTRWLVSMTHRENPHLPPEERNIARETYRTLRSQGDQVMLALARELPVDRQGIWGERIKGE